MNNELIFSTLYWIWLIFCITGSNITLKEFFLDTYFPKPIKPDQENIKPMFEEEKWERDYRNGGELIIDSSEDNPGL